MKVRRFLPAGEKAFAAFATKARANSRSGHRVDPVPEELLYGEMQTQSTPYVMPNIPQRFASKMDLGQFISGIIPDGESESARLDAGLWSWLAAALFDQITAGRTKIKEERAYLAELDWQKFYRHLILGPYFLYFVTRDNPERVRVLLYDEPTTMNEVLVQFGSYQTLMQNKELQTVIQRLYFDADKGRIKRGAGGKAGGSPRRLMSFFRQIEINYDLPSITAEQFWAMLPAEFDKFKKGQERMPV